MASDIAKDFKEQVQNSQFNQIMFPGAGMANSSATFAIEKSKESIAPIQEVAEDSSSSSYTLASDQSLYSHQIDRWLQPDPAPVPDAPMQQNPTESAAVQLSRVPLVQRSTLMSSSSIDPTGLWYLLAMVLPLFSVNNAMLWRCTPDTFMNAADMFLNNVRQYCSEARVQVLRLAEDRLARDFFATLMDIVLVIYAIGFLILSLYQASVFG